MKKVLLFGAGKSATCLIDYLIANADAENWHVTIVDVDESVVRAKTNNAVCTTAISIDIRNEADRNELISAADIVISLMPPALHFLIAQSCLELSKNLLTASYVDDYIKELSKEITEKGLLFLCEMGLDPGIDHMSAMQIIDDIKAKGGTITSFKSHCGGLVAPESDDNPWHYKISWNPRNVVNAGKAGAIYKENGEIFEVEVMSIFAECHEIEVAGAGTYAYYANRDSLSYIPIYHLEETETFIRTTLRHPAFCRAWNQVVWIELADTEDAYLIKKFTTIKEWFFGKLYELDVREMAWDEYLELNVDVPHRVELTNMFEYLGLFSDENIPGHCTCSADILQWLMERKWVLQPHDKDMVVMVHEIGYEIDGEGYDLQSTLVVKGEDQLRTAMAKTVGLPLGIATKLILNGTIQTKGLHIPINKEIYEPVLKELKANGVSFTEKMG